MDPSVSTSLSEVFAAKLAQKCTKKYPTVDRNPKCRAADLNVESMRMAYNPARRFRVNLGTKESSSDGLNPASAKAMRRTCL